MALVSSIGVSFVVLACFGALVGQYLDRKLETSPWMLVLGLVAGMGTGFLNMVRMILAFHREGRPRRANTENEESE